MNSEEECYPFDPLVEKIRLGLLYGGRAAGSSQRGTQRARKIHPDPTGSTMSTANTLTYLRNIFGIPEDVEFLLPSTSD